MEEESCLYPLDMTEETIDSLVHLADNGDAKAQAELERRVKEVGK